MLAQMIVFTLASLALIGAVVWHLIDVVWARRLAFRRRVLVNLTSGRAVTGVLHQRRGRTLVLKSAEILEPGASPVPMDGDVLLDRDQVEYVQVAG